MTLPGLVLLSASALAGVVELKNDSCVCDGSGDDTVYAQGGFVDGECFASVFVPDASHYPFTPLYLNALISGGGTGTTAIFDVSLWSVDENNQPLADLSGAEAFQATSSEASLNQLYFVDLKTIDIPVVTEGNLALVVCLNGHSGYPAIARDADGNNYTDRNWIRAMGESGYTWVQSDDYRVAGDWILRLGIDAPGGGGGDTDTDTDADTDTDTDADTDTDLGELELYAITPTSTEVGVAVDLVLLGDGFVQGAEARIGGLSITGATVQDEDTISGRSPTSLPEGVHDVEVRNPDGSTAYLAGAFTVEGPEKGCGCLTLGASPTAVAAWAAPLLALSLARRRRR